MSPALADGFLTTAPPGKFSVVVFLFVRAVLAPREEFMEGKVGRHLEDYFVHPEMRLLTLE